MRATEHVDEGAVGESFTDNESEGSSQRVPVLQRAPRTLILAEGGEVEDGVEETVCALASLYQGAGVPKNRWTEDEDMLLVQVVQTYGAKNWPKHSAVLGTRTAAQCRERWTYNLQPDIKKTPFGADELLLIQRYRVQFGNRWTKIAEHLEGRTSRQVKNAWYSSMRHRRVRVRREHARAATPRVPARPIRVSLKLPRVRYRAPLDDASVKTRCQVLLEQYPAETLVHVLNGVRDRFYAHHQCRITG